MIQPVEWSTAPYLLKLDADPLFNIMENLVGLLLIEDVMASYVAAVSDFLDEEKNHMTYNFAEISFGKVIQIALSVAGKRQPVDVIINQEIQQKLITYFNYIAYRDTSWTVMSINDLPGVQTGLVGYAGEPDAFNAAFSELHGEISQGEFDAACRTHASMVVVERDESLCLELLIDNMEVKLN